jgi:hypothetical protein
MDAIRIRKRLDSHAPHLPELRPLIGKTVEIIILDDTSTLDSQQRVTAETFFGLVPPLPAPEEQAAELEKLRALAADDPFFAALPLAPYAHTRTI